MTKRQRFIDQQFRLEKPYCFKRQPDGRYVAFNREYQPLAGAPQELPGLTPQLAACASSHHDEDVDAVYLYDDGCFPTASRTNMLRYEVRLALLEGARCTPGKRMSWMRALMLGA